jgi:hypothetical protein
MRREPTVGLRYLRSALIRVISSLICAGIFYLAWLAGFLLVVQLGSAVAEAVLWLLAPPITAAGFAGGVSLLERLTRAKRTRFVRLYAWPLTGCIIGAGAVYWFGPMLIVFGMFAAGTMSMVLREVIGPAEGARA